jgi:hypothetical protein
VRFDWYQATVGVEPAVLIGTLAQYYGAGHEVEEGRGLHGYRQRFSVCDRQGAVKASVLCGGNRDAWPNAWASGYDTDAFVDVIRGEFAGKHVVTRCDASEDFAAPDAYTKLRAAVRAAARGAGVKCREILPDEDPEAGRTYYAGAPSSAVRARVYDKGRQLRAMLPPEKAAEIPEDLTRIEVQVRPKGESRQIAARIEAAEVWGFAGWTKVAAVNALALDVPRVSIRPWRESDDERAYRFLLRQYGPLLARLMPDYGSWAALGSQVGYDLGEMAKADRVMRACRGRG